MSKRIYTHVYYEPWHYRYVGKEDAIEIMSKNLCLEKCLNIKYSVKPQTLPITKSNKTAN